MAERAGGEVTKIEKAVGRGVHRRRGKEALARVKPQIVAIVMAETSTGAWQPIEEIAAAVRDAGAMLILDTVTALGGIPVEIDRWQIDAVYSGTQKCLGCPPGLAPVSFSERAVREDSRPARKGAKLVSRRVADRQLLGRRSRVSPHGADQHDLRACTKRCGWCSKKGSKRVRPASQESAALQAGLAALGIEYATQAGPRAAACSTRSRIPDGVDDAAVRKGLFERFGIEIGAGLGAFKGKVWRIGLMGYSSRPENVLKLLDALEQFLADQKRPVGARRGGGRGTARRWNLASGLACPSSRTG